MEIALVLEFAKLVSNFEDLVKNIIFHDVLWTEDKQIQLSLNAQRIVICHANTMIFHEIDVKEK